MKRILYVNGTGERAGAERILLHLLNGLDRDRFEPVVAFLNTGPFIDEVASTGVSTMLISEGTPRVREPWRWGGMIGAIESAIVQVDPHVVQATGEKVSIFVGRAAHRLGVPSIGWLHDAPGVGVSAWMTQLALRSTPVTRFITCAAWMAEEFNRKIGLDASPIVNSIEIPPTDGGMAMKKLKVEAGWDPDALVVGHFARLQRWKGSEVFVRAAKLVADRAPEARFILVGDAMIGREMGFASELHALARDLDLERNLFFTGYRTDALDLMGATDIVTHCSLTPDPLPTVILEAMALGKPVVATKTKGPEEEIVHGESGLITEPGDAEGLAEAVLGLVQDPARRSQMGESASKRANAHFTGRRMAEGFEALYAELAGAEVAR